MHLRLFLLALLVFATPAPAWDVKCLERGEPCTDAASRYRGDWRGEHQQLCRAALARLKVTELADQSVRLGDLPTAGRKAAAEDANELTGPVVAASRAVCEFAELPDHAFGLRDYLDPRTLDADYPCPQLAKDAKGCHDYTTNIGPLNSTHFGSQAVEMYRHYHQQAVKLAGECKQLGKARPFETASFTHVFEARACELRALAVESVGQHFLQDRWSIGHMWERWGSPDASDMPDAYSLAAFVGIIHGAEAMVGARDGLCSYTTTPSTWLAEGLSPQAGVGDMHVSELLSKPEFKQQRERLLGCSARGYAEVLEAGGRELKHGKLPSQEECGQRPWATNESMYRATALGSRPAQEITETVTKLFEVENREVTWPFTDYYSLAHAWAARVDQADKTHIAREPQDTFLEVRPNDAYLGRIPPRYFESFDDGNRDEELAVVLHGFEGPRAACAVVTRPTLERWRDACREGEAAACRLCAAGLHLRVKVGEQTSACGAFAAEDEVQVPASPCGHPLRAEELCRATQWSQPACGAR
ncbi:hypothetical protein ACN469_11960 [Corallococcus terminator]